MIEFLTHIVSVVITAVIIIIIVHLLNRQERIGTQAEQKKFIGNAVEVTIARKLCEVLCSGLRDFDLNKYNSKQTA